jgi:SHS2 domain-containing protein
MTVEPAIPSTHEFIEHTGEVQLRIRAANGSELFAEAGRALALLLARGQSPGAVGAGWRRVELAAPDRGALLVDWLNELIYLAESERVVPTGFEVARLTETGLEARFRVAPVEESPTLVKAATLHGVRVEAVKGGIEADVILDV